MSSQPEESRPRNRRRLIVDKPFQHRLIGLLLGIWGGNTVFAAILYFFYQEHLERFYRLVPRPGVSPLFSASSLGVVTVAFFFLFGLAAICIVGAYLSNQIAGPLYRVKVSLNRVTEGDLSFELRFRDRDFLFDFPEHFNAMLRSLQAQGVKDVEALKEIEANLEQPSRARDLLAQLREQKETRFADEVRVEEEQLQLAL